jgi:hypothetical protein
MSPVCEAFLVSTMSAALDRFPDDALGRPAMRLCAYPPEARASLINSEYARLDSTALTAQRARRSVMATKLARAA